MKIFSFVVSEGLINHAKGPGPAVRSSLYMPIIKFYLIHVTFTALFLAKILYCIIKIIFSIFFSDKIRIKKHTEKLFRDLE